jgi:Tol biopolymer transport system component
VRDHGGQPAPGTDPGLYLVDSDGSNRRYLTNVFVDGSVFHSIDWSPDGRLIIVDHSIEDGMWADLILSDSGEPKEVRDTLQVPSVFHWSPDGRQYLVREWLSTQTDGTITQPETGLGERTSSWSLRRADGTLLRRFVSTPGRVVTNVAWMPDSQRFMMLTERADVGLELIAADISGGQSSVATYPYPLVTTNQLAVSPSGDLLAIDLGQSHIVIMDVRGQVRMEFDGRLLGWRPRR